MRDTQIKDSENFHSRQGKSSDKSFVALIVIVCCEYWGLDITKTKGGCSTSAQQTQMWFKFTLQEYKYYCYIQVVRAASTNERKHISV